MEIRESQYATQFSAEMCRLLSRHKPEIIARWSIPCPIENSTNDSNIRMTSPSNKYSKYQAEVIRPVKINWKCFKISHKETKSIFNWLRFQPKHDGYINWVNILMNMAYFELKVNSHSNTFEYSNDQVNKWGQFECSETAHSLTTLLSELHFVSKLIIMIQRGSGGASS